MMKSHGIDSPSLIAPLGRNFETVNILDILHTEAETLAKGMATTIMELRVLDAIIASSEQTRIQIATALCPGRPHIAFYAIDNLYDRRLVEHWLPDRAARRYPGRTAFLYRITQFGEAEINRIIAGLDMAFDRLFRGECAGQLAAALKAQ